MKKTCILFLLLSVYAFGYAQDRTYPVPKPMQWKWHEAELGVVFHYDLHVFDGQVYGQGNNRINPVEDYNIFNPTQLNTDQWIEAAKAAGAKFAVLTATHETGFGLWQSDVNPYCLKAVKWRDGKGDIVRDFVNSCRKYGIQPGIYIGIRWNSLLGIHNFKVEGNDRFAHNRQQWYRRLCEKMVTELCTRYGDLYMIWFDGGADDPQGDGPDVEPIVNKYQPDCLFYHNVSRADFRWGGSETGTVGYPCWSAFPYPYSHSNQTETRNHNQLLRQGDKDGKYWVPAMADTPLRGFNGRHEWFWEPGDDDRAVYPLDSLMDKYEKSVGRNATLILGLTPNPEGLLPEGDVQRLKEMGDEISRRFATPLASASGQKKNLTLNFGKKQPVNYYILQENIKNGERIRRYSIEAKVDGKWTVVSTGESVGHKRIERFPEVEATALRVKVDESVALPDIRNFSAYRVVPASAPSDFTYRRGKAFTDVPACRMSLPILPDKQPAGVIYEQNVPAGQTTIAYKIELPSYEGGLFFSRDCRPGDYNWPNNTNRLLPWSFRQLGELRSATYQGIPSNGGPSAVGDALLLRLGEGRCLFLKAVSGENSISWLQVNKDGTLTLYLSTLGTDKLSGRLPLLLCGEGESAYKALGKAYQMLIDDTAVASLQRREDKEYYEAFRYLGWCSWEHYHTGITETNLLQDIDKIKRSDIPVRYVLIDDGHVANRDRQLTSFVPDRQKFPSGWKNILSRKQDNKIKWMGLWYNFTGYWLGISSENDFPENINQSLYPYGENLLPGKSNDNIRAFYHYYVKSLKDCGFDFLKIDNQSFMLPLYMGGTDVIRQAKACNLSLEEETKAQGVALMNCMAQNVLNTDQTRYSSVARVSIDYKKFDEDMAKSHLYQSYTNTLLQGQTVWPDHDMFHSCDSICGSLMARSKAVSGGPVYLSDSPDDFVKENIFPLIDTEGKLFRPVAPAVPTPESLWTNPLKDGKAYRVVAPVGDEALAFICYNLNTSPHHRQVAARISPADYLLRESLTGVASSPTEKYLLYDWQSGKAEELVSDKEVELNGFTDRLFFLCPVRKGWAVIGMGEKYLSPAAVQILSCTPKELKVKALCPGTLRIWQEKDGKGTLKDIPVHESGEITIYS